MAHIDRRDSATENLRPAGLPAILIYLLRIIRDFVTFFIRGGLSTLMFCMDMALSVVASIFENLHFPGSQLLVYAARFIMWLFQVFMWVVYTMLELLVYLPIPFLFIYAIVLGVIYALLPNSVDNLIHAMFYMAQNFLRFLQYMSFGSPEGESNKVASN